MKKIYLTLMFFAIVGLLSAQQVDRVNVAQKTAVGEISQAELQTKVKSLKKAISLRNNNSKATQSRWYNAAFTISELTEEVSTSNMLFPDSTILVNYGTSGYAGPWLHSMGECVDPTSEWYEDAAQLTINEFMPYTVDSIGIYALYSRKLDVVDTLAIQIRVSSTNYGYFTGWTEADYGVDTLKVRNLTYDAGSLFSTDAGVTTIKIPLTAESYGDTLANGIHYFTAGVNHLAVPAGQEALLSYSFIPGYTWTPNVDTLASMNNFRFISDEENGEGTYPIYNKGDFTASYALTSVQKNDPTITSYNSAFNYYESWNYEHHWVELLLTADPSTIGINNSNSNGLMVSQNRPNPFTGNTTIGYNLDNASNVNVTIYNVAGAKVMDINEGVKAAGSHNLTINGSSLQAGVYFYTFTANNNTITKKMIVY